MATAKPFVAQVGAYSSGRVGGVTFFTGVAVTRTHPEDLSARLLNTVNDSDVTIRTIAESSQGFLVSGAVMGRYCLFNTIKFD